MVNAAPNPTLTLLRAGAASPPPLELLHLQVTPNHHPTRRHDPSTPPPFLVYRSRIILNNRDNMMNSAP